MKQLQNQLQQFATKYSPYIGTLVHNMRLVLLVIFSIMSAYLVYRVNTLMNLDVTVDESVTSGPVSKTPDKDVLSIFNELYVQDVDLQSEFDANRENPF